MKRLLLVGVLASCVRHVPIDKWELDHLEGYGSDDKAHALTDREGGVHELDASTPLYLVTAMGKRTGGTFKTVNVDAQTFSGELVDGSHLELALSTFEHAEIDRREVAAPIAMGLALVLAVAAAIVVGVMAINGLP
jgi:hypothetical protein